MNEQITTAAGLDALPPLQHLVLEVLAARHRLGESLWTFTAHASTVRAIHALEAAGLIEAMGGIVPRTVRASLTDKGRAAALSATYHRPDAPERTELTEEQVAWAIAGVYGETCAWGREKGRVCGLCDCNGMTEAYARQAARAVLALLPQRVAPSVPAVTEQIRALHSCSDSNPGEAGRRQQEAGPWLGDCEACWLRHPCPTIRLLDELDAAARGEQP